jgi:formylglycine-generating enzyme required for sulfatase activity
MSVATADSKTGTLIVTYQTGPLAERLNRIRFHLMDEDQCIQFFPKHNAYVDDFTTKARRVVIENLQPGLYTLAFCIPNCDNLFERVPPKEIKILSGKVVKVDQTIHPRYGLLKVSTSAIQRNKSNSFLPTVTLQDRQGKIRQQSHSGQMVVRQLQPGNYTLVFEDFPGYKAPQSLHLHLGPNESLGPIEGTYIQEDSELVSMGDAHLHHHSYEELHKSVLVPEGKVILGDPLGNSNNELPSRIVKVSAFYIGIYEVTNAQYAKWLNQAIRASKVLFQSEGTQLGLITDSQGRVLCKTVEADPQSQIQVHKENDSVRFDSLAGYERHPVIFVTWEGAKAYCQDNQCRLPTEAEWEKAAGMALTSPGIPPKKYRFGFSQNEIDPTWANYKSNDIPILHVTKVLTTPVGFYDGIHTIQEKGKEVVTKLAKSPVGAFDMSGNVWEWVEDWYDDNYYKNMPIDQPKGPSTGTSKVVKGGCYDSLADGVRVAERMGLPLQYADQYTGFRIAFDP